MSKVTRGEIVAEFYNLIHETEQSGDTGALRKYAEQVAEEDEELADTLLTKADVIDDKWNMDYDRHVDNLL